MILPFSQYFDKEKQKETFFAEKIFKCFSDKTEETVLNSWTRKNDNYKIYASVNPKKHTIRIDEKNRWKAGNLVHCVFNNRQKNQFQFCPVFLCKSVQKIEIKYYKVDMLKWIKINDKVLFKNEIEKLAINDGFENVADFLNWFNKDFTGKIIHFTDFLY